MYVDRQPAIKGAMSRKKKVLLSIILVAGAVLAYPLYADMFHVYTVRDDNGGTILWNSNEAYLFMSEVKRGYRMSWPGFAVAALFDWFNAPSLPSDQHIVLTVIHVTSSGVERHIAQITKDTASVPHFFTPVGLTIYAFSEGVIYKLSADHFDPATADEQAQLGGIEHLSSDSDVTVNGWEKRGIGKAAGDFEFSARIGNAAVLKVHQGNVYKSLTDSPTVELHRPGQPVQELWHVNGDPHRVSRRDYERALSTLGMN